MGTVSEGEWQYSFDSNERMERGGWEYGVAGKGEGGLAWGCGD